MAIYIWSDQ